MAEPPSTDLEEVLLTELAFECEWFLGAWKELLHHLDRDASPRDATALGSKAMGWSYIDRMLTHLHRIDRILNPSRGHDSADSYEQRKRFAAGLRTRISPDLFPAGGWETVRNIVEHGHEFLPDFLADAGPRRTETFSIGALGRTEHPGQVAVFRAYDTETGECVVLGRRLNLRTAERTVRRLHGEIARLTPAPRP